MLQNKVRNYDNHLNMYSVNNQGSNMLVRLPKKGQRDIATKEYNFNYAIKRSFKNFKFHGVQNY